MHCLLRVFHFRALIKQKEDADVITSRVDIKIVYALNYFSYG